MKALIRAVPGTWGPRQKSMKCGTERVLGENLVGFFLDQLDLHPVVGVFFEAFGFARELPLVGQVFLLQLQHPRFDFFEVFRSEGRLALEVVVEAGVGGRTDAELGLGKQLQHRRCQKMRSGVPVDLQRLGILRSQNLELGVGFKGPGEVV